MNTYFAPAERANENEIAAEIETVCRNPVLEGLLHSVNGLLAVLNEHRQVLAINDSFMRRMGIHDPEDAFGLRPGEVLRCIYSRDEPEGCGTTKFCSTCGLAVAIVSSLARNAPAERICALSTKKDHKAADLALLVKSHPIRIGPRHFLLLFLQDITQQQQRAALERTFYHDVNNMLTMLVGASDLLVRNHPSKLADHIREASLRLHKEIAIQRCLSESETCSYHPVRDEIAPERILFELRSFFATHPAGSGKRIDFEAGCPEVSVYTDKSLLLRVLCNMVINALEATETDGAVQIRSEQEDGFLSFCVRNGQEIPEAIANRIFQRNFSTKEQAGRGIGTFSMKFFGEKILGGRVRFTTSREEGTEFRFSLPL